MNLNRFLDDEREKREREIQENIKKYKRDRESDKKSKENSSTTLHDVHFCNQNQSKPVFGK